MKQHIKDIKWYGIIEIPRINLKYPILEETNSETLKISITKFWGGKLNGIGNVVLSGHNYINNIFFGGINKLENGDIIEITDETGTKLSYEVFKTYIIGPNDISVILPEREDVKELTLITCTNGKENRFVVKSREKIKE